jgi:adenine-specific DNA-methyltransferase
MNTIPLFEAEHQADQEVASSFETTRRIVLHEGDAREFVEQLPTNAVKLIVTSPPYNLGKNYERRTSIEAYLETQTALIAHLVRVLRDDGSLCWQVGNFVEDGEIYPLDMYYYPIFKRFGLRLRNRIVWHFRHGLHNTHRFSGRYETLLWFTKSDEYTFNLDSVRVPSKYPGKRHYKGPNLGKPSGNPKGKNPSDVWEIMADEWERAFWDIPNVKSNHPEKTDHPCQFPVELVERCVLALTEQDDWVFDPYAGVGSSLIAALKQDRRALGCELDAGYAQTARERIRGYFAGALKLRPLGKPVHEPTGNERVARPPDEWADESEDKA